MKILRLEAENFKRLKAVEITPKGDVVTVRGKNGAGKSSCLDAIACALGGKSIQPPKPIREGATEARVVLELDDLVIERKWTSNERSYLEVRTKEGVKVGSPQTALDKLVGALTFDPLDFLKRKPSEQLDLLRSLTGVDLSDLEAKRSATYREEFPKNEMAPVGPPAARAVAV